MDEKRKEFFLDDKNPSSDGNLKDRTADKFSGKYFRKFKRKTGFAILAVIKAISFLGSFFSQKLKRINTWFDRMCCFVGMCLLNDAYFIYDIYNIFIVKLKKWLLNSYRHFITKLRLFAARNEIDLTEKKQNAIAIIKDLSNAYEQGFRKFGLHLIYLFINFTARFCKCIFGSVNYLSPILATFCMLIVVSVTLNMTFALEVKYNGQSIGYISDEAVFDSAEKEVLKRIVFENYIMPEQTVPEFSITAIKDKQLSTEDDITNQIIRASGNELTSGSGLYVDDQFLGAIENPVALENILSSVKKQFATDDENEEIEFVKKVECKQGLYPTSSVVSSEYLNSLVHEEQSQQRVYKTVAGDSPILIAQKNGIPYSQLKALNPEIETKLLIGQDIIVEKAVPMLEVKVVRTVVEEEEISFKIEQVQDTSKYQGYVQVSQPGEKGIQEVTSKVTYIDGIESGREILSTNVVKEPVNEKVVVGGKKPLAQIPSSSQTYTTSNNFRWPVDGGTVTCLFGSAGYWGHTGLDIGRMPQGTAVRAAAAGTVVKVRYDTWNYGYHVIIDHGGNVQTLYAHNSKIYVKVGDWVEQGQLIAGMGRTGRATGVHVHFEVRVNGKYMNPANYIGLQSPY